MDQTGLQKIRKGLRGISVGTKTVRTGHQLIPKRMYYTPHPTPRTDARLVLFYKIIYDYVVVPLPGYGIPLCQELPHSLAYLERININTPFTPLQLFSGIIFQLQLLPWPD